MIDHSVAVTYTTYAAGKLKPEKIRPERDFNGIHSTLISCVRFNFGKSILLSVPHANPVISDHFAYSTRWLGKRRLGLFQNQWKSVKDLSLPVQA